MSTSGDIVPVSLPIIQHVQERLHRLSEDAGYLSEAHRTGAAESGGADESAAVRQRREAVLSRLRSIETGVQALKLNFASLASLQRRPTDAEQRLLRELTIGGGATAMGESAAVLRELAAATQELADVRRQLARAESERVRHKAALDEALADAVQGEGRAAAAEQRVGELQAELLAEKRLRELLEQSHATALEQLRDLQEAAAAAVPPRHRGKDEAAVADEEVQQLKSHLADLQKELFIWKELQLQQQQNAHLQAAAYKAIGEKDAEIRQLQHEKQFAVDQVTEMHARYNQLNEQLDQMHAMLEDLQRGKRHRDRELEAVTSSRLDLEREVQQLRQLLAAQPQREQQPVVATAADNEEAELTERLNAAEDAAARLEAERIAQTQLVETLKALIVDQQNDNKNACETLRQEISELRQLNAAACCERDELLQSRQSLLDEVNAAAELMSSEKERMDSQLQEQYAKVTALQKQLSELEATRSGLEARVSLLQQQVAAHAHFEQTIAELLEQKSKLAYENGQLLALKERLHAAEQDCATTQQQLLASGAREEEARLEAERLRAQYVASNAELTKLKADGERSYAEVERLKQEGQRLTEALAAAMAGELTRKKGPRDADEAQKDAALLSERVEELEDALKAQASVHQHTINSLKQDSATTTVSLEGLVELHAQLQTEYEKVQKLLGKRDGQLQNMRLGSKEVQRKMGGLEKELESAKKALAEKEAAEASKVKGLQQSVRRCKQDNFALVKALKECYEASRETDAKVRQLESELANRVETLARLQADRLREREELAAYHRDREERTREEMETLAAREREKVYEKVELDMQQLQQEVESLLERVGDLQAANDSLEARLRRSESAAAESLAQHAAVLAKLDASEVKRRHLEHSVEKLKSMTTKLAEMERLKDQYMRKSSEQERQINDFAEQIRSLQAELKDVVASLQSEHDQELREARRQVAQERRRAESLSRRFDECEGHLRRLEQQLSPAASDATAAVSPGGCRLGDNSSRPAVTSRNRFGGSSSSVFPEALCHGGRRETSQTAGREHEPGECAISRQDVPLVSDVVSGRRSSSLRAYGDDGDWQNARSRSPTLTSECSGRASASAEESQMIITAAKAKHFVQASQAMLSRLAEAARLCSPHDTASDDSDCRSSGESSGGCRSDGGARRDGQPAAVQRPRRRRRKRVFRVEADLPHTPSFSASESSTRQLEALIEEMERRNLISS